jgi:hypothetical protein
MFGWHGDAVAGGSTYDDLVSGNVPIPNHFWVPTGGNFDDGISQITHDDQVRAFRGKPEPISFKAEPKMTLPLPCYMRIAERALANVLGGVDTVTGSGPYNHDIASLGFGETKLPALHTAMVRDDEYIRMSGSVIESAQFSFDIGGEGSISVEFWGLFYDYFDDAPPTATYVGLEQTVPVLMLRDAKIYVDGDVEPLDDVIGFDFGWKNNITADDRHNSGQNVQTDVDDDGNLSKLWHPAVSEVRADPDITYALRLRNPSVAQAQKHRWSRAQAFVVEIDGAPLADPLDGNELLRFTIRKGVHTAKNVGDLQKSGRISAEYTGMAYYDEIAADDVKVEIVSDRATALSVSPST